MMDRYLRSHYNYYYYKDTGYIPTQDSEARKFIWSTVRSLEFPEWDMLSPFYHVMYPDEDGIAWEPCPDGFMDPWRSVMLDYHFDAVDRAYISYHYHNQYWITDLYRDLHHTFDQFHYIPRVVGTAWELLLALAIF